METVAQGFSSLDEPFTRLRPPERTQFEAVDLPLSMQTMTFAVYGQRGNLGVLPSQRRAGKYPEPLTLIYLHGLISSRTEAAVLDAHAKKLGIRIIAIDRPGYGQSEMSSVSSLKEFTNLMAEFLDVLGICPSGMRQCALMGVSAGGIYASASAYFLEDRFDSLSLTSAVAYQRGEERVWPNFIAGFAGHAWSLLGVKGACEYMPRSILKGLWAPIYGRLTPKLLYPFFTLGPKDRELLKDGYYKKWFINFMTEGSGQQPCGFVSDFAFMNADPASPEWGFYLDSIKVKTFVYHGTGDWLVPESHGEKFLMEIKDSEGIFYQDEGHLSVLAKHGRTILSTMLEHGRGTQQK